VLNGSSELEDQPNLRLKSEEEASVEESHETALVLT
jgi:hypothetical protein